MSDLVLVSYVSYNKLSQTWWLNTNLYIYSSGGQKSKISFTGLKVTVLVGLVASWESKESPFPCFLQFPVASCIPWLMAPSSVLTWVNCTNSICFPVSHRLLLWLTPSASILEGGMWLLIKDNLHFSRLFFLSLCLQDLKLKALSQSFTWCWNYCSSGMEPNSHRQTQYS